MAAHSSILAWRIPWTEEPGGLQSTELQSQTRLRQLSTHAHTDPKYREIIAHRKYFLKVPPSPKLSIPPDLPGDTVIKSLPANAGDVGWIPGLGRYPGEGNGNSLQYSCLGNPTDRGAWWAAVHGVSKSRTRLSDFTFTFHSGALEKEMATHSSVLAWRIPETEEPGRLPSLGSRRVGHD